MSEAEYGCIRPFHIDNGQLDGLRRNECFVLGYELAIVDAELMAGTRISRPIHSENACRLLDELRKCGRPWSLKWMAEDVSEAWQWLEVAGK